MHTDSDWLEETLRLATQSVATGGGPFASVVVRDGQLIAAGINRVTVIQDPTAHGEVMAIRNACQVLGTPELRGCVLYTSCEPCPMCAAAIYWARLDACHFAATSQQAADAGFDDQSIFHQLALPPERRSLPMTHVDIPHAIGPFNAWRAHEPRKRY